MGKQKRKYTRKPKAVESVVVTQTDELELMNHVVVAFNKMNDTAVKRVMDYLTSRYA